MKDNDKIKEELQQNINTILTNDLIFKQVTDDPGGYLNSKEHVNEFLIRFVYVNSNNELVLDGEEVIEMDTFLKIADALVEAKYYGDVIDDWDSDSRIVLSTEYSKLLEEYITDKQDDGLLKFFPISAFFYSEDGIIYETDLYNYEIGDTDVFEDQNMMIEDCDEFYTY